MAATASTALARCAAEAKRPTPGWKGQCLKFCRTMFGIPARYGSAIVAWNNANSKHSTGIPPAGTFVFWRIGQYGHIAISAGGGYCWSTDIRGAGTVARVPISEIKYSWGATYLGWTEDVNEVRVYTPPKAPPTPTVAISLKALQYSAKNHGKYLPNGTDDVLNVKGYLVRHAYALSTDSFATAYAKFQRHLGYRGTNADGIPGMVTLRVLCRSANWKVVA